MSPGQLPLKIIHRWDNLTPNAPMLIHDTKPPGVATMTRLKGQIHHEVSEIDRGAKLRVVTTSPDTTDAIHAFLLFIRTIH